MTTVWKRTDCEDPRTRSPLNTMGQSADDEDKWEENGLPKGTTYDEVGLPTNYRTIVKRGDPDGKDPNNPIVLYADGCFDMYHIGHAKLLE